jgi:hypothetical protein
MQQPFSTLIILMSTLWVGNVVPNSKEVGGLVSINLKKMVDELLFKLGMGVKGVATMWCKLVAKRVS